MKNHFDVVADTWNNKVWAKDKKFAKDIVDFCGLKDNEAMLYVGIGTGDMAQHFKTCDVVGIDISKNMLSENKQIAKNKLIIGDANNIPFLDDTFDVVFSRNLIKHVDDPTAVLKEMRRVVKKGGQVITIESCVLEEDDKEYPNYCVRTTEPNHNSFMTIKEITDIYLSAKLKNISNQFYVYRSKWLKKWIESSKASVDIQNKILKKYQSASPEFFLRQKLVFTNDNDIESDIIWSFAKGRK
jgi:ubiquinone/menaquinone biosynthesis C-methylase UbiE